MTEEGFWSIVERSRERARGRVEHQPRALERLLRAMKPEDILAFRRHLLTVHDRAYTGELATAARLLLGGVTDDRFTDFRTWLVCHGRKVFERALAEPDSVADLPSGDLDDVLGFAEEYGYVPDEVYEELTGEEPPDETINAEVDQAPVGGPLDERDLDGLEEEYPRLVARARAVR